MVVKRSYVNDLSTFPIKGKRVFINDQGSLLRNPPNCIIFEDSVFENFILAK